MEKAGGQRELTEQAQRRIENAIERWGQSEIEDQLAKQDGGWAEDVESLISAVRASERLSEGDFAIRINTHG